MILYRNRLLFGVIKSMFGAVFGVVGKLLALLNLQITAILLLLGLVLYFTGTFEQNAELLTIFQLLVVLSAVYAVIATIKSLLGLDKKVKKSKGAQIVSAQNVKEVDGEQQSQSIMQQTQTEKAVYFRVKQNPEYVMAEYADRYELFRSANGKLVKVRTDYKGEAE